MTTELAVCENEPDVIIYGNVNNPDPKQWKKEHILSKHSMVVTGIDWCKQRERIVTCSHDVNAFVWTYDKQRNEWKPNLSILRIDRAALRCLWSPDGTKFAVSSASKLVSVCYYQKKNDWYFYILKMKHIKIIFVLF